LDSEKKDYLKRFNRWLTVPTLALFIVLAISGFGWANPVVVGGLTGGLFGDRYFCAHVHAALALPTLILLMVHVLIALRSTLIRWGVKEGYLLNTFVILLGFFVASLFVVMQYLMP